MAYKNDIVERKRLTPNAPHPTLYDILLDSKFSPI